MLQQGDTQYRELSICYGRRVLRTSERKWSITDLQVFAGVWALETFRGYIEGSPTLVRTYYSPLLWLRSHAGKSFKLPRWILRLQEFAFALQHRKGRRTALADAPPRHAVGEADPETHGMMFDVALCAFLCQVERCQAR